MSFYYVLAGTCGFALGIFLRTFFVIDVYVVAVLAIFAVMVGWWGALQAAVSFRHGAFLFIIASVALAIGVIRTDLAAATFGNSPLAPALNSDVMLEGVVMREPDVRARSQHLYVLVEEDLLLVTTDPYLLVAYGDLVQVEGELQKPEAFVTDLGRSFNYPGYLMARGVEYRISFAEVVVLRSGEGNFFYAALLSFKERFTSALATALPEPEFGLGVGLLLGVKQALGDTLEDAFRQTGIIHIVVLSGYNVMLVVAFVMYVFSYFLPLRARVIAGLCAITAFALLVGLSATVVRASIMAGLLLIASALGRTYDILRGLLFAGALMLFLNPYLLVYDVGFQLSFLATLGLILVAPQFENLLARVPTKIGVREFMIATVATQIAVLPLLLYQIGELSLVAVFVNVLVLPMVPVAMLLTFIIGMAAMVSASLASLFVYPTYLSLTYIVEMALWWASVPFAAVVIPALPFYVVPVAYFVLGVVLWWFANRQPLVAEINNSNLSDWTIVEEVSEVAPKAALIKPGAPQSGAPDETPIFFR